MKNQTLSALRVGQKVYVEGTVAGLSPGGGRVTVRIGRNDQQPTFIMDTRLVHPRERATTHNLEECQACGKNIDTCCGPWFYGDTRDALKVHRRCEKRWDKMVSEFRAEEDPYCGV